MLGELGCMVILTMALSLSLAHTSTPPPKSFPRLTNPIDPAGRSRAGGADFVALSDRQCLLTRHLVGMGPCPADRAFWAVNQMDVG